MLRSLSVLLVLFLCIPAIALADDGDTRDAVEEEWLLVPFTSRTLSDRQLDNFMDLVEHELSARGASVTRASRDANCTSASCAREIAEREGANWAVFGSINELDERATINSTVVDISGEQANSSQRVRIDDVNDSDELESAADDLADAMFTGRSVRAGETTDVPEESVELLSGFAVHAGAAFTPRNSMQNAGHGMALDVAWNVEGPNVQLGPRIGWRFSPYTGQDSTGGFSHLLAELRFRYFFTQTMLSPFIAGGAGVHWLTTRWLDDPLIPDDPNRRVGQVDRGFGAGLNMGAGVMFPRGDNLRFSLNADYELISIPVRQREVQHLLITSVGVHF